MPAIVCRHVLLQYVVAAEEAALGPADTLVAGTLFTGFDTGFYFGVRLALLWPGALV